MFNRQEAIKKAKEDYQALIDMIEAADQLQGEIKPHGFYVNFVSPGGIFLSPVNVSDMEKTFPALQRVFGTYKIQRYYPDSADTSLAIVYDCGGTDVVLFVTPIEEALERVSGGKCRLEPQTRLGHVVVCDAEGV